MEGIKVTLEAARVNAKLTQDEKEKRLHVTKQTLVNWEKYRSEPTVSQAREISEIVDMPLDCIIFMPKKSN